MVRDDQALSVQDAGAVMIRVATDLEKKIEASMAAEAAARLGIDWQNMTPEQAEALSVGVVAGIIAAERDGPPPGCGRSQDA